MELLAEICIEDEKSLKAGAERITETNRRTRNIDAPEAILNGELLEVESALEKLVQQENEKILAQGIESTPAAETLIEISGPNSYESWTHYWNSADESAPDSNPYYAALKNQLDNNTVAYEVAEITEAKAEIVQKKWQVITKTAIATTANYEFREQFDENFAKMEQRKFWKWTNHAFLTVLYDLAPV